MSIHTSSGPADSGMLVLDLLRLTRSGSAASRSAAESKVEALTLNEPYEFISELFTVAESPESATDDAQSALLVIKLIVVRHWSPGFEQYTGKPLSHEIRACIRKRLLELVACTGNKLTRQAAALVISRIGGLEFPDEWPDLLQNTLEMLSSDSSLLGGLILFKELLVETLRERDFFDIGNFVLYRLMEATQFTETCLPSLQCFHECINFFLMGDDEELKFLGSLAADLMPKWISLCCDLMKTRQDDDELQTEVIDILREMWSAFEEVVEPCLSLVCTTTLNSLARYDPEHSSMDLAAAQVDLTELCVTKSRQVRIELQTESAIDTLVSLCIQLATLQSESQALWSDDVNEFVTNEQDEEIDAGPRPGTRGILSNLGRGGEVAQILVKRVLNSTDWPNCEAALYLLEALLSQVPINTEKFFDVASLSSFLSQVTEPPVFLARVISISGVLAKFVPDSIFSKSSKLSMLRRAWGPFENATAAAAGIKTLSLVAAIYPEELKSRQEYLFQKIADLVPVASDDTPTFLLDCMLTFIRLDFERSVKCPGFFDIFFALAGKDTANVETNAQIVGSIEELLDHSNVAERLLTPIMAIIRGAGPSFEFSNDFYFALDLAGTVFEKQPPSLPAAQLLPTFQSVMEATDDPEILQAASFAYSSLVSQVPKSVITADIVQKVLNVAARLLNPELEDSAALAVGRLVRAIIDSFGDDLGPTLIELIDAAARRLTSANNALLVENLVLVFCELLVRNPQAVVDLLYEQDLLGETLVKILATFQVVSGADEIVLAIRALQKLFDLHDNRVDQIKVNDEPMIDPNVILTRSRSKNIKFTQVSVHLKIVKLLVGELSLQLPLYNDDNRASKISQSNDDNDWEDEVAVTNDGTVVDRRNFGLIMDWFKGLDSKESMKLYSELSSKERSVLLESSKKSY